MLLVAPAPANIAGLSVGSPEVDLRQSEDPERLRELAAVIGVVAEQPLQNRPATMHLAVAAVLPDEPAVEHLRCPTVQTAVDDIPGRLQCPHQLVAVPWGVEVILPGGGVRPLNRLFTCCML